MKKEELEKRRLNQGLNQPIDANSKGYELLVKMGFKPGTSLGKRRDEESEDTRIKEPIGIPTKFASARTGLGHEQHQKEKEKMEEAKHRMVEEYKVIDMTGSRMKVYGDIEAFSMGTSQPTVEDYTPQLLANIDYLLGAARGDVRKADRQLIRLEDQIILLREEMLVLLREYYRTLSYQLADSQVRIEKVKESYKRMRGHLPPNLLALGSVRNELTRILQAINRAQRDQSHCSSSTTPRG